MRGERGRDACIQLSSFVSFTAPKWTKPDLERARGAGFNLILNEQCPFSFHTWDLMYLLRPKRFERKRRWETGGGRAQGLWIVSVGSHAACPVSVITEI